MSVRCDSPDTITKSSGFLFAFYRYSHSKRHSFIEKLVSVATQSDCIHVAIIPVKYCEYSLATKTIHKIVMIDKVYTAFIGYGFEIQNVSSVISDAYEYIFFPVEDYIFEKGKVYIESFNGSKYNYFSLPFTLIPSSLKKMNSSQNHKDSHSLSTIHKSNESDHHSRVFCSQLALMLLYECGIKTQEAIDPSFCSPGDLKSILLNDPKSIPCIIEFFELISG